MSAFSVKTKKIITYGKRNQRFIPSRPESRSTEDQRSGGADPLFIKSENKPKTQAAGTRTNKSSTASTASVEIISNPRLRTPAKNQRLKALRTPGRKPLAPYSGNVLESPIVPMPPRKPIAKTYLSGKGRPYHKSVTPEPLSPYVQVDIIVLDDDGNAIRKERRVSRPDVQVNPIVQGPREAAKPALAKATAKHAAPDTDAISVHSSASEDEEYQPKTAVKAMAGPSRPVRQARTQAASKLRLLGDHDEDDDAPRRPPKAPVGGSSANSRRKTQISVDRLPSNGTQARTALNSLAMYEDSTDDEGASPKRPQRRRPRVITSDSDSGPEGQNHSDEDEEVDAPRFKTPARRKPVPQVLSDVESGGSAERPLHRPPNRLSEVSLLPLSSLPTVNSTLLVEPHRAPPRQLTPIRPKSRSKPFPGSSSAFILSSPVKNAVDSTTDEDDIALADLEAEFDNLSLGSEEEVLQFITCGKLSPQKKVATAWHNFSSPLTPLPSKLYSTPPVPVPRQTVPKVPSYLTDILAECRQATPLDFDAFLETFRVEAANLFPAHGLAAQATLKQPLQYVKVGEASFSEVYAIGNVVIKVIPLRDESIPAGNCTNVPPEVDVPSPSDAADVLTEIIVTRAMGNICGGFIKLLKSFVVRGKYPSRLLTLWDEYRDRKGTESARPDTFTASQTYAVIALPNGGPDLEAFMHSDAFSKSKTGWRQSCSIFWQIARSLATAEDLVRFEHRDLHWGQILIQETTPSAPPKAAKTRKASKCDFGRTIDSTELQSLDDPAAHGVQATIIDLGLSRIDKEGSESEPYWTPFDEIIFESDGDYQHDVYKLMRQVNGDSWEEFTPFTNVLWLHYLADKLLEKNLLKVPGQRKAKTAAKSSQRAPTGSQSAEKAHYDCLIHVESVLGAYVQSRLKSMRKAKGKGGRRKTVAVGKDTNSAIGSSLTFDSARDVVRYGQQMGWLQA